MTEGEEKNEPQRRGEERERRNEGTRGRKNEGAKERGGDWETGR